jgi:hypothetical protein
MVVFHLEISLRPGFCHRNGFDLSVRSPIQARNIHLLEQYWRIEMHGTGLYRVPFSRRPRLLVLRWERSSLHGYVCFRNKWRGLRHHW